MLDSVARVICRYRWSWIAAAFAVLVVGATYGAGVFGQLRSGGLDDPGAESQREAREFDRAFPSSHVSVLILLRDPLRTVDSADYRAAANDLLDAVRRDPATRSVTSFYSTSDAHFVSRDRHETYALVAMNGDEDAQTDAYLRLRRSLPTMPLQVIFGGPVVGDYEINQQVQQDIPHAEMISGPITLILLVFLFRSVIAALLPLLIGALTVLGSFAIVRVLAGHMEVSTFAPNIISLLGLGLAIDYSLLFVSRFRDELVAGRSVQDAIAATMRTAGESIFFSGGTVALSLLGMLLFPDSFLRSMGIGGALATVVAVGSSLTVLPAILAVLGAGVNRGAITIRSSKTQRAANRPDFWFVFSHAVMDRAVPVMLVTLAVLLALGIPFLHTRFANQGADSLPATFASRITTDALRRDFAVGQDSPIQVVVDLPAPATRPDQMERLYDYVQRLRKLPGVRNVDSLVSVDPRIPRNGYPVFYSMGLPMAEEAKAHFASGNAALVMVDYKGDSQDSATLNLVRAIRAIPPPSGAVALVGGDAAELVDRLDGLRSHIPVAGAAIMGATLVLLCVLLSSIVVPIKAVVLNVLSLAASFGLMTWIFQDGHLERLLNFRSSGSLDANLPVLIFCLAFGLSTDYEVFLVSRIKEEYRCSGDNTDAVARGVEKTGRIITSAALLLIVVVAAFGASAILPMKEIGVGLSIAVFIDAAVVRTLLVPATMRVFGDLNWWVPRPFARGRSIQ